MQTPTEPTGPTRAKKFPKLCSETWGGRFATKTLEVCKSLVSRDDDEHENTRLPPGHLGLYFRFVLHKLANVVNLSRCYKMTKTNLP